MDFHMENWILEACILALLEREDFYGYRFAKSTELQVAESTIYPALRRLTDKGYLNTYSQTADSRLRKYYAITPAGRERLASARMEWNKYRDAVDSLLETG
jgi:PadR family transcriptional regulator PadR